MSSKRLVKIIVFVLLVFGCITWKSEPKINEVLIETPVKPPTATTNVPEKQEKPPATHEELSETDNKIELSQEEKGSITINSSEPDFSCRIKRENKDIPVTPGIVYRPGEGINIKVNNNKEEAIVIKRDNNTKTNSDYQILWQKKY